MSKFRSVFRAFLSKSYRVLFLGHLKRLTYHHKTSPSFNQFPSAAFLSWFLTSNQKANSKDFDAEKQITQMIAKAEECIVKQNLKDASTILKDALKVADENQAYDSLAYLCDLLSTIMLSEGELFEAENMLVKFTEKLLQHGFPETHNTIVKFKLKLARLHQLLGSQEMAEYGLRDCILAQEKKMEDNKALDAESNGIYLTALFWYGKLLADQKEYALARRQYKKCLERISKATDVHPSQKMVVLHNIASVSAILKDYDRALNYLFDAIEICLLEDPNNPDLPIYLVKVGTVYLQKEIYEGASFWCQTGLSLATHEGNQWAEVEGQKCIKELQKLKILK